ncbi:hypothetical protein NN561_000939 [Cricetulus griseus]
MRSARRRVLAGVPPVPARRPVAAATTAAELPPGSRSLGADLPPPAACTALHQLQTAQPDLRGTRAGGSTRPARSQHRPHPAGPCRLTGTAGQLGPRGLQGCGLRDPGPIASARAAAGTGSHPARPALTTASLAAAHPPGSAPPPAAAAVRRVNIPASPRRGRAAAGPSPRPHPAPDPRRRFPENWGVPGLWPWAPASTSPCFNPILFYLLI